MIVPDVAQRILDEIDRSPEIGRALKADAMRSLATLPNYDWCGVYRLEDRTLVLEEFVGEPTDHTHIEVGVGVCGTAVATDSNQVVDDVRSLENYLSCSVSTRSEIVTLIRRAGVVLGQIDVDGHRVAAFDDSDERFLDRLGTILAARWEG